MAHGYNNLNVWKKSYEFTLRIYNLTKSFPMIEKYGLISQMRRAAISIVANIAEGYGYNTLPGYKRYISISIGSCNELGAYLKLSLDLNYLKQEEYTTIKLNHEEITRMLLGLRGALEHKIKNSKS